MEDDEYQWQPFAAAAVALLPPESRADLRLLEAAWPADERRRRSRDLQRRLREAAASGGHVYRDDAELKPLLRRFSGPSVTVRVPREDWEHAAAKIDAIEEMARERLVAHLACGEWEARGRPEGAITGMVIDAADWLCSLSGKLSAPLPRWRDVVVRKRRLPLHSATTLLASAGLMIPGRSALADSITAGAVPTLECLSAVAGTSGAVGSACQPSRSMTDGGPPAGWQLAAEFSLADKMPAAGSTHRAASEYADLMRQAQQEKAEREARWAMQRASDPLRDGPLPPRVQPPPPPAPQIRAPVGRSSPAAVVPYAAPEVWPAEGLPFRAAVAMMLPQAERDALLALYARGFPHGPVGFLARSAAEVEAEKQATPLADAGQQALLVELESGVRTATAYDPAKMERRPVPSEIWRLVPAGCAHLRIEPLPWPGASHPVEGGADAMLIISPTGRPIREVPKDQRIYWREVRVLPCASLFTAPPAVPEPVAAEASAEEAISDRDPAARKRGDWSDDELEAAVQKIAADFLAAKGRKVTQPELRPLINKALPGLKDEEVRRLMRIQPKNLVRQRGERL